MKQFANSAKLSSLECRKFISAMLDGEVQTHFPSLYSDRHPTAQEKYKEGFFRILITEQLLLVEVLFVGWGLTMNRQKTEK